MTMNKAAFQTYLATPNNPCHGGVTQPLTLSGLIASPCRHALQPAAAPRCHAPRKVERPIVAWVEVVDVVRLGVGDARGEADAPCLRAHFPDFFYLFDFFDFLPDAASSCDEGMARKGSVCTHCG